MALRCESKRDMSGRHPALAGDARSDNVAVDPVVTPATLWASADTEVSIPRT